MIKDIYGLLRSIWGRMAFISKSDVVAVSFQVLAFGVLVLISTMAIDLFFSPIESVLDIPLIVLSYVISIAAVAAFFTIFVRRDDLFRQKQRLHDELSSTVEDNGSANALQFASISFRSIIEGKDEFMETASGVGSAAAVLLLLIKTLLIAGGLLGYSTDGLRADISSTFTNVIYLVALLGILFKDRKLE